MDSACYWCISSCTTAASTSRQNRSSSAEYHVATARAPSSADREQVALLELEAAGRSGAGGGIVAAHDATAHEAQRPHRAVAGVEHQVARCATGLVVSAHLALDMRGGHLREWRGLRLLGHALLQHRARQRLGTIAHRRP